MLPPWHDVLQIDEHNAGVVGGPRRIAEHAMSAASVPLSSRPRPCPGWAHYLGNAENVPCCTPFGKVEFAAAWLRLFPVFFSLSNEIHSSNFLLRC